jgi:hypothetical protein
MKFDRRLDTRQAAAFLVERGYRVAPATLNKLRCVGGGPEFELFGRRPLYTDATLLEWIKARTKGPRRSTSDRGGTQTSSQDTLAARTPFPNAQPLHREAALEYRSDWGSIDEGRHDR